MTTEPVEGIGDKAVFEASTGKLFVLQGDTILFSNVFVGGSEPVLGVDRQLMEIMLTHL